jgi:hypothetical protein
MHLRHTTGLIQLSNLKTLDKQASKLSHKIVSGLRPASLACKQGKFHQQLALSRFGCWAHDQMVMHLKHNTTANITESQNEISSLIIFQIFY